MDNQYDFSGKVAVVTGAGTGVGRATAGLLAAAGARVALAARRTELLEAAVDEIVSRGGEARAIPTDVRNEQQCQALIGRTLDEWGALDVVVNAAGGTNSRPRFEWTERDWNGMLDLNLRSAWILGNLAGQAMGERDGGAIVNVSSIAGISPNPAVAPYGIAKAGLIHLTSILATDFADLSIRVNCVALGMIKSEGFLKAMEAMERDPDDQSEHILFGRPGTVLEAAHPIVFLASDAASYITGETLYVGGGPRHWSREPSPV